jgi:hypothetical protein
MTYREFALVLLVLTSIAVMFTSMVVFEKLNPVNPQAFEEKRHDRS